MPDLHYHERRKIPFIIGNIALSILIFVGDLAIHMDVAGGVLYIVVVLWAMWLPERLVYLFSATSTLLILLGSLEHFGSGVVWEPLANRGLAILAIWVTAILGLQRRRLTTARLRDSQIMGQVQDSVIVTDPSGYVTFWNNGSRTIFGYTEEEALGRRVSFLYPMELQNSLQEIILKKLLPDGSLDLNVLALRKSGEKFSSRQRLMVRQDDRGQAIGALLYIQDVSKKDDTELELRKMENYYHEVLNALPLQVAIFDKAGRFVYLNPASLSDPEKRHWVIGKTEREYFESVGRNKNIVEERERWHKQALEENRVVSFVEEFRTDSGSVRTFQHGFCPMPGATEQVSKLLGYRYDITELKQSEQALKESLALNRAILYTAGDGIVSVDCSGKIEAINEAALQLFDLDMEEAIGSHVDTLLAPCRSSDTDSFLSVCLGQATSTDGVLCQEARVFRKNGPDIPIDVTISEVRLSGRQLFTAILRDVSERLETERTLKLYNERLEALRQIDQAILTTQSVRIVGEITAGHLLQMIPAVSSTVVLLDFAAETAQELTIYADLGETQLQTVSLDKFRTMIDSARDDASQDSSAVVGPDILESSGLSDSEEKVDGLAISLRTKNTLIGFLCLKGTSEHQFTNEHVEIAREVASSLARAIRNAQLFEEVDANRKRLQTLSRRLVQVQEVERRTMARELHDEIGQTLTGLKLSLEAPGFPSDDSSSDLLNEARGSVLRLLGRVRDMSLDLRPAMLDDLGLAPALLWLMERYNKQTGLVIDFKHSGIDKRYDPEVETAAYRIVQEALTNVARHSHVDSACVWVIASDDRISVTVKDEGSGFNLQKAMASGSSSGLAGMYERVKLLDGTISVETAPDQGTYLTAELPVSAVSEKLEIL